MLASELYRAGDPELVALRARAQRLMRDYNATVYGQTWRHAREALLASQHNSTVCIAAV